MSTVFSVSMNKGGVGKTSLVTNLAGAVVNKTNSKILIIDTDGQGNTSAAFGFNPNDFEDTIYDVITGNCSFDQVTVNIDERLDLVPANSDMDFLDFDVLPYTMGEKPKYEQPFFLLKNQLDKIKENYDYIFIDTPPSLSLVAGNVLVAADKVIIPFVPELFGVQGLLRVVKAIADFKRKYNPSLDIAGVVGMMVDQRTTLHTEMMQQARQFCLENEINMFDTIIPKSIRFANATAYDRKPAVLTEKRHKLVSQYFDLMKEVI